MNFRSVLGKRVLFFDGAMGTMLQNSVKKQGCAPEEYSISEREAVKAIHRRYIEAGSDIITANTFGAYGFKYGDERKLEEIVSIALQNAREAITEAVTTGSAGRDVLIAMDMGPTGKLLKPMGELSFEESYKIFKLTAGLGARCGADLFILETFSDMYETKAAVLAAKETGLPVICTMTFDETGHTLTGADPSVMTALLEGLGVDALGLNCGFGPAVMKKVFNTLLEYASIPILIQPNAGMPVMVDGVATYTLSPEEYAADMLEMCEQGAWLLGGCCGTSPEHITRMVTLCRDIVPQIARQKTFTTVTSFSKALIVENGTIIGGRINLGENEELAEAVSSGDLEYIVDEAMEQVEDGADILGVNLSMEGGGDGLLLQAVETLQEVVHAPLCLEASSAGQLEAAVRLYNGKPMFYSPDCRKETLEAMFFIAGKYGGVVVVYIDEEEATNLADREERSLCDASFVNSLVARAARIADMAGEWGLDRRNIMIDIDGCCSTNLGDPSWGTLINAIKDSVGFRVVRSVPEGGYSSIVPHKVII